MESKITELFTTIIEIPEDKLNDKTSPENFENWDSFKHLILVAAYEEEFDISIEPEEIIDAFKNFLTFKNIIIKKLQ